MRLVPDDDIYRARLVYLGPPGYTLPWQVSYAQYGVFIALVPLFLLLRFLLTWHVPLIPVWELCGAWLTSSVIFRYVNADRPAPTVVGMLLTDWRAVREPDDDMPLPRLAGKRLVIRNRITSPAAARPSRRRQPAP